MIAIVIRAHLQQTAYTRRNKDVNNLAHTHEKDAKAFRVPYYTSRTLLVLFS